jgi:cyclohexadienyl dehydratase
MALKVIRRALALFVALLALAAPGTAGARTLAEIADSGILLVGIPGDYEPFAFPDYDGEYIGHDIDAARVIGQALGVEVSFIKSSWPDLTKDLLAGRFDMAAGGVTRTLARQKEGQFSDTVYYFGKSLIVRKADQNKFAALSAVNQPSVKVGVNPGGTNERFARAQLDKANIVAIDDNMSIPGRVAKGELDAMVSENVEVKKYLAKDGRLAGVFVEKTLTRDTGGYFFRKSDRELLDFVNLWLSNAKVNGSLEELYNKWIK